MTFIHAPAADRGFLYATTGPEYTTLARRAARTLRQVMPDAAIDLFTDQTLTDPVFDQIHPLSNSWFRPRMEAIRRSRFERTVVMDADTIVLRDVSELFDAVETVFLAGVQATGRPADLFTKAHADIPRSFPYINGGVLVLRNSPEIRDLCEAWEHMIRVGNHPKDQPALRRLLHLSGLPFQILPQEYNIIYLPLLDIWEPFMGPPCILHIRTLHERPPGDPMQPFNLRALLGPRRRARLARLTGAPANC